MTWLLFATSVVAAAVMVFALDIVFGSLAFWIDDITGIDRARGLLAVIFRGQLVPLALMPAWAQEGVAVQPFRFTLAFSLELLLGDLSTSQVVAGMALQMLYPALTMFGAIWIWRRGMRAYTAAGA